MHRYFIDSVQFGDQGGVDKGSGTMPLSILDYPPLNNMDDIELDALHDHIQ